MVTFFARTDFTRAGWALSLCALLGGCGSGNDTDSTPPVASSSVFSSTPIASSASSVFSSMSSSMESSAANSSAPASSSISSQSISSISSSSSAQSSATSPAASSTSSASFISSSSETASISSEPVSSSSQSSSSSSSSQGFSSSSQSSSQSSSLPPANGALARLSNTSCIAPEEPVAGLGTLSLTAAFPNLPALSWVLGLYQSPGNSSHWYAVLRDGDVVRFANNSAANSVETFISLPNVRTNFEMGLLDIAFHPNFASNGEVFVSYNDQDNGGRTTLSRLTYSGSLPIDHA
ncbi:MAG TPA: PQQ-dependent sugar dehydrogenase, partial [Marinobacter sp.]|nr:PQQ-dependent sugar dehydrogenase [Marinobacter sp.]